MSDREEFNIEACKEFEKMLDIELKNKIDNILDYMVYQTNDIDRIIKLDALKKIIGEDSVSVLLFVLQRSDMNFLDECEKLKEETKNYFIHLKAKYGINLGLRLGNSYYNNPNGWMRLAHIFSNYDTNQELLWLKYKITKNDLTEYYLEDSLDAILSLLKAFTDSLIDSIENISKIDKKLEIKEEINEFVDTVNRFKTLYDPISK